MTKKPTRLETAELKVSKFSQELDAFARHLRTMEDKAQQKDIWFTREMQNIREAFQLTDHWRRRALAAEFKLVQGKKR